jgi:SAM-dependent methyltransferase
MTRAFRNVYEDGQRARAYAELAFPGTYYLAFRDVPKLVRRHVRGTRALDFGCGTGRSSRFLRGLGLGVVGVDIAAAMLEEARRRDPAGDYRHVGVGDLRVLAGMSFDLVFAAFTFDNIPTDTEKAVSLAGLRAMLAPEGRLIAIVSSPEIYVHEWASFSTKDFPANRDAGDGDRVRIIMLDVPDRRPVDDVVCGDVHYRQLFAGAQLDVRDLRRPLATGEEPTRWVSETTVAPWSVYVLGAG